MKPYFQVKFQDGSVFEVPTDIVAQDRAAAYHERDKDEFPTLDDAIKDTTELFTSDTYEIEDWAKNNMNWDELEPYARLVAYDPPERDWSASEVSFHDERQAISEPVAGDNLMKQPMELALVRLGIKNNVCNLLKIGHGPDTPPVAVVAMIRGGPHIIDYFLGGLRRLTEALTEPPAPASADEHPSTH